MCRLLERWGRMELQCVLLSSLACPAAARTWCFAETRDCPTAAYVRPLLACMLPLPRRQVLLEQELGPLLRQAEAAVRADVA